MIAASSAATQAAIQSMLNSAKAMGPIIQTKREDFITVLHKQDNPLIVTAEKGLFSKKQQYLMPYRQLYLYCETPDRIELPGDAEVIIAKSLWIPTG